MNTHNPQAIETLRISDRDKAKLLWAIEQASPKQAESGNRRLRVAAANNEAVMTVIGDGGGRTRFSVLARDLSRWGASLLHGRYLYPGTRCEIEIRGMDNAWQTRAGEVRHIRHVQGMIHNLGICFDEPIDLTDFATLSPEEETRHLQELADDMPAGEEENVQQLVSRVLVVDDYSSDRKLFSYWLSRSGVEVSTVNDGESARSRVEEEHYDLMIVDKTLDGESGAELISVLRNSQFVSPILGVSATDDEASKQQMITAGANAFLAKPFTCEQLTEIAFELMGRDTEAQTEPIYSTFKDDQEMRPLLTAFTRGMAEQIKALQNANAKNDYDTIDEIARTLKGAGSGYGFATISEQAVLVQEALDDSAADMAVIRQTVNELIDILNRVRLN